MVRAAWVEEPASSPSSFGRGRYLSGDVAAWATTFEVRMTWSSVWKGGHRVVRPSPEATCTSTQLMQRQSM